MDTVFSENLVKAIEQGMAAALTRSTALCVNEMHRVFDYYNRRSEARRVANGEILEEYGAVHDIYFRDDGFYDDRRFIDERVSMGNAYPRGASRLDELESVGNGEEAYDSCVDGVITPRGGFCGGRRGGFGNGGAGSSLAAYGLSKVGRKGVGVVTLEEGRSADDNLYVVEGMQFDRGYNSPYFVTDSEEMTVEFVNCKLLLADKKITKAMDLINDLEEEEVEVPAVKEPAKEATKVETNSAHSNTPKTDVNTHSQFQHNFMDDHSRGQLLSDPSGPENSTLMLSPSSDPMQQLLQPQEVAIPTIYSPNISEFHVQGFGFY